ncbi:outer membrane protein assembly factor BamD [Lysobacter silvisoli]|uniref:Outer membrane protein assembly factor BamD n=1 Tax=Lysobacter silvisoli TaxID=2293254 RepID=A0A371K6W5_9GAMM|nr:outer membrane protein assembly factor BamD [Lysobacter silvisoli]RDZ29587.1 outer membrane protein assembly factor BamD [Lysobacter silvisoli]
MTLRSARSARLLCLLLLVVVAGTGCGRLGKMFKDKDADEGQPVEALYDKAHTSMTNGNWAGAEATFKRLVAQYPYGPYTEQALVETAYAQFKSGKHDDAISSIDRFIRTYPTHRYASYMYYLRGLVNSSRDTVFLQRVWRLDASRRDLATPTQAYNDFAIVAERYPNSRYAADARQRMIRLRDMFARHELDLALYYLRRTAYVAAADRAKYLLETYPQSKYQNDAVATLAVAYHGLGNEALANDAKRVLQQNEPEHAFLRNERNWPDYPSNWRKLNPFAGEKSALDNVDRDQD